MWIDQRNNSPEAAEIGCIPEGRATVWKPQEVSYRVKSKESSLGWGGGWLKDSHEEERTLISPEAGRKSKWGA
ncbi:hypothetical protein R50912_20760 [Paenibacillus sp. FSL R5-0912]|nr:hypothetical protein R50912_20760 [Paenibacillus sp. FSL R5-0912]